MALKPSERTVFVVDSFAEPSWLLWRTPIRTWASRLVPLTDQRTRLITHLHTVYDRRRPWTPVTVLLMELGDYPMMRECCTGSESGPRPSTDGGRRDLEPLGSPRRRDQSAVADRAGRQGNRLGAKNVRAGADVHPPSRAPAGSARRLPCPALTGGPRGS